MSNTLSEKEAKKDPNSKDQSELSRRKMIKTLGLGLTALPAMASSGMTEIPLSALDPLELVH